MEFPVCHLPLLQAVVTEFMPERCYGGGTVPPVPESRNFTIKYAATGRLSRELSHDRRPMR